MILTALDWSIVLAIFLLMLAPLCHQPIERYAASPTSSPLAAPPGAT